ncbi:hypothetical protein [Ideonella sp.]|uniref:hypothetical protein n=1 Tax=Ideonella sp. TaxID=1929293 RepID=UPI003BB6126C
MSPFRYMLHSLRRRRPGLAQGFPPSANDDRYQPTSRRQRVQVLLVSVVTVVLLWILLLLRPGGHPRVIEKAKPVDALPACSASQTTDCVGGQANVLLLPAAPAASSAQ